MMIKRKFLIAGLGSIGRRHLRNLEALDITDIFFYRTNQSTLPDEDLGEYPVYTNLENALETNPDAVVISNPTFLHMQVAIPAVEAGCALLIEKPISHRLDDLMAFEKASLKLWFVKRVIHTSGRNHSRAGSIARNCLAMPTVACGWISWMMR